MDNVTTFLKYIGTYYLYTLGLTQTKFGLQILKNHVKQGPFVLPYLTN